jgi:FKBP-type peptidyl-prolyl cis-trans isomerase
MYATSLENEAAKYGMVPVPLEPFVVGEGKVIAGLDKGLQRMSQGEHGLLIFPFTQGYGKHQVGVVPPESALAFEVWIIDVQ